MEQRGTENVVHLRPLRILYLHPTHSFGGAEKTSLNLLSGLDREKFLITLVTSKTLAPRFSSLPLEKIICIEDLGMDTWFGGIKTLWKDVRIVAGLAAREDPDLVFGMMHYCSTVVALAKKFYRLKARVISSPRGPSTPYLRNCFERRSDRLRLGLLFALFCRWSDALVVPSAGTKGDCVKNFGARAEKVKVINNSVDVEEVKRKSREDPDLPVSPEETVISTAGRLSMEKNIPLLLAAFARLVSTEKVKLLIIGDGPEREKLESLAAELGIGDDTVFVGFQENPYPFIRRSDLFVHTCLVEGFGNIIVEAMACGVPVVATDCPYGPGEIIRDGESGILVPMNDADALKETLRSLLHDPQLRERLAEGGLRRAADFSIGRMVKAYEDVFLESA